MRGPALLATRIAYGMTGAGFLIIFLAWNGAASFDTIQQQFPYLLSGGLGGIGLIVAAMGVLYVQRTRLLAAEEKARLEQLAQQAERLLERVTAPEVVTQLQGLRDVQPGDRPTPPPPAAASGDAPTTPLPRLDASASAVHAAVVEVEDPTVVPAAGGVAVTTATVVAGRSSYHVAECHLVAGRDDLPRMSAEEADAQGLSPCRVCKP